MTCLLLSRVSRPNPHHHHHPHCAAQNFAPLFRGTIPLMGHSMASAILGLVGQPRLQKYVQETIGTTGMLGQSGCALTCHRTPPPVRPPTRGQVRPPCLASLQRRLSSLHGLPTIPLLACPKERGRGRGRGTEGDSNRLHTATLPRARAHCLPHLLLLCSPSPPPPRPHRRPCAPDASSGPT